MTKFKQGNCAELFRTSSKAIGEGDEAVCEACDDILAMFDDADGDRVRFIESLRDAASYCSWKPKE